MDLLISTAFSEAEKLLRRYGFVDQADAVRKAHAAVQASGDAAWAQLAVPEWWAGPDSIADTYLYKEGESLTAAQEHDNRKFRAAMGAIHETMRKAGVVVEWKGGGA